MISERDWEEVRLDIDAAVNTFWRNQTNTYVDDTDIEAGMTTTWNQCAKGSGAKLMMRGLTVARKIRSPMRSTSDVRTTTSSIAKTLIVP